ncbi:MAG: restriction endonuclease subunit S [Fretibacterium sp.]|nr:restriction endonuclease subunit S [Fretibacterium sp.]
MKYKSFLLEQLASIKYGKNQKKVQSDKGEVPIYGTGGFMGYATEALYSRPSVLIGRKGTINKVRYVDHPFWTVDTLFYTEVNEEVILPKYFYYAMSLIDLDTYNEGTTIPSLRTGTLNQLEFDIPDLDYQGRVLSIVEPLDEKIKLNMKINENLQAQARIIFAREFLDFGTIPAGWNKSSLLEIANYLNGLAMQKFRPSEDEVGLPVLKIKELRQGRCDSSSELCSPSIKEEYIVHDGDVIFSWSGSLLVDLWCGGICGLNQHLFKVTSDNYDKWFYYAWTNYHLQKFAAIAADMATTMGHIKREELAKAEVLIPSQSDYDRIGALLAPMYDLIIANRVENRQLILLRDSLLPRLMSGEIDVSDLDL